MVAPTFISGLSKVQKYSTSCHATRTISKSLALYVDGIPLFFQEGKQCSQQMSSLGPQPDFPASEMSVLWLNTLGPIFIP